MKKDDISATASCLKALAHPVRLQIILCLARQKTCCCNDFCNAISLAQSTISQHLKILHTAGILDYRPAGNCSNYSLNPDALKQVMQVLAQIHQVSSSNSRAGLEA